jgi:hypothetical protein
MTDNALGNVPLHHGGCSSTAGSVVLSRLYCACGSTPNFAFLYLALTCGVELWYSLLIQSLWYLVPLSLKGVVVYCPPYALVFDAGNRATPNLDKSYKGER